MLCSEEHMQRKTGEVDNTNPPRETNSSTTVSTEQLTQALGNVVTSGKKLVFSPVCRLDILENNGL